ncbi:MAG: hypothetical protein LW630_12750 [Saprospiraceae bacterium]|nr:hypothetical protein [Saprospiraceae bacterium]
MTGIEKSSLKAIRKRSVRTHVFQNQPRFLMVKHVHDFTDTFICQLTDKSFIQKVFYLQCQITQNHGQRKVFQRPAFRIGFVPLTLGIVPACEDLLKGLQGHLRMLPISRCLIKLTKSLCGKAIRKNVVGLYQRPPFSGQ